MLKVFKPDAEYWFCKEYKRACAEEARKIKYSAFHEGRTRTTNDVNFCKCDASKTT